MSVTSIQFIRQCCHLSVSPITTHCCRHATTCHVFISTNNRPGASQLSWGETGHHDIVENSLINGLNSAKTIQINYDSVELSSKIICNVLYNIIISLSSSSFCTCSIKYPTRQYAMPPQPVVYLKNTWSCLKLIQRSVRIEQLQQFLKWDHWLWRYCWYCMVGYCILSHPVHVWCECQITTAGASTWDMNS